MSTILKIGKDQIGNLVSIYDVDNGKDCNCFCVDCEKPLLAKNKGKKRTAHFSHLNSNCTGSLETYLHHIAKEIISQEKEIFLPTLGNYSYNEVFIEKTIDSKRPDAIIKSDQVIAIEILVTNPTSDEKIEIFKKNGMTAFEIDLSTLDYESDLETIREQVIFNLDNKTKLNPISDLNIEVQSESNNSLTELILGIAAVLVIILGYFKFHKRKDERILSHKSNLYRKRKKN